MNPPTQQAKQSGFLKKHALLALLVFVIPVFSVGFFRHAENRFDAMTLKAVEKMINNSDLPESEKQVEREFFQKTPVSRILASNKPEHAALQQMFQPSQFDYFQFRWMKRTAWICLGSILATLVLVGISVALSFRSQSAQYNALRIGWPVLRTAAAIQVIGQGLLAVALSYWVTALWFEFYALKLILIIGLLALVAVASLVKAIFRKMDDRFEISGELLAEEEAPELWNHIRNMASKLGTAPPDQIILGVEPSFFVTEHDIQLAGKSFGGRTLFLSLPMLKIMTTEEADAVLGHELGHFSGEDTLWSRKISPLMAKFSTYIHSLSQGLSLVVALFLDFFWKLYMISIRRLSREREFRSDLAGAGVSSPLAMKRALIKVAGYCEYRHKTEEGILAEQRVGDGLPLANRLEQGFPNFLSSFVADEKSIHSDVPHPFDTHPPMEDRLRELGYEATTALGDDELVKPVQNSWYQKIGPADALEKRLWAKVQEAMEAYHGLEIAYRLNPATDDEVAMVEKYFPTLVLKNKDGEEATLDYRGIHVASWAAPILFTKITGMKMEETLGIQKLAISHIDPEKKKPVLTKFKPVNYLCEQGNLLGLLEKYYGRHLHAASQQESET